MSKNKSKGWSGKTRGGTFGYQFFIFLIDRLGVKFAYVFLVFVVVYFIPFAPKATKASWWYARNILQKNRFSSFLFLFKHYYRFGQTLIDKVAISAGNKENYEFVFDDTYSQFLNILHEEKGAILVSAHVGNWEIGAPFFDKYGKKMHITMLDAEYQKIKEMLEKRAGGKNYNVLPLNEDDGLKNIFQVKDILDKNEYVCFQGDRFLENMPTVKTLFMNKQARFPIGPFLLASRMQVPIVFYFSMREKGMKYKFHFHIANPASKEIKVKSEIQILQQYTNSLEYILKEYPEQWFNYYQFWE